MTVLMSPPPRGRTGLAVLALAVALTVAGPATASAHVRVSADDAAAGSFSLLTFRVPTESDTASTTKLQVQLPQDTPLQYVSVRPVPGWQAKLTEAPLPTPVTIEGTTLTKAVRTVTWTAEDTDDGIAPGEFQQFAISAGPLPAAGTLLLPATQTYSDGSVVTWDEPTPASGEEPEHPAPVLEVTAAAASGGHGSSASTAPLEATASASAGADGLTRGLSAGALVVALGALVTAVLALRRRRSA